MQGSTYFGLLAEFGTAEIPLKEIAPKYFGFEEKKANQLAGRCRLPIPAYRGGSQKSKWLVSAADLAGFIDQLRQQAETDWNKVNH